MFATLEFIMVACLFADMLVARGAQIVSFLKGAEATVASDASAAVSTVVADVKKVV